MAPGESRCALCGGPLAVSTTDSVCSACGSDPRTAAALAAPPVLPAPGDEVGGMVVRRRLDEGGMGHVLVAYDPGLDRHVALKFLHRRLVGDRGAERRFLREGRALAGVDHPGVVKVYSVGAWNGWPFLAMEFVEGTPLARLTKDGRMSVPQALRVAEDLAAALAAIHALRIVHRDVKPANVVLRHRDGSVCLLDFGLARSLSAMTETSSGAAGTPFYMAPEQIAGRRTDQRADVYAFGATLFEMLTGRVPHEHSEGGTFYHDAMHRDAPIVSSLRSDAPRGLDTLLARALARAPELRQPDGRALLAEVRALRRGLTGTHDDGASAVREPTTAELAPPHDPNEELPLVGRDAEYAAAARAIARVGEGAGRLVLVEGGSGAGKSRLLRDLERRARADGLTILRCAGTEGAGVPFAPLRAALLDHARAAGAEGPAAAAGMLVAASPDDEPLAPALRRLLGAAESAADAPQPISTLVQAAIALVRFASGERPAVLFADDLHLLDEASLDVLVALAEEAASMPFAVVAAFRPVAALGGSASLAARLPRLTAARGAAAIALGPLSEAAVASMIHRALRISEAEACRLAPVLHKRASGNPLYLVESLRLLEQEGHVAEGAGGERTFRQRMSTLAVPPRMMELALRRIAGLPPEERDTLGVVSIDPDGVTAEFVTGCRGATRLAALRILQQLVGARGLVRHDAGRYLIAHSEIREAVYGELIPELRAAYHDQAARAILDSGEAAARPARLGRHLRLAGRRGEAVAPLLAAGTALLAGYSPAEALDLFEEAIACAGPDTCPEAEVAHARALEMLGELDRARSEFERLAERDGATGVVALIHLVAFERNRGRDDAALLALARAQARDGSPEQRLVLSEHEAELLSRADRGEEALAALARAEAFADRATGRELLRLWATEGTVRFRLDRHREAKKWLGKALDLAEELGVQEIAVNCLHNLSLVYDETGEFDEALRWAERAVERAALVGADRQHVFSLLHLAGLLIDALRLDEAEAALARLEDGLRRLDSDEARYSAAARDAELALARGDFRRALGSVERGYELTAAHPRNQAAFHVLRAQALLGLRRAPEALDEARRARGITVAVHADADAEEALALAARALREIGREGAERDELRALEAASTFAAALEKSLGAEDDDDRRRWGAEARRLAIHPRWRADLEARGL